MTVPQSAVAVSINVTVVKPSGSGHITVFPCGVAEPQLQTSIMRQVRSLPTESLHLWFERKNMPDGVQGNDLIVDIADGSRRWVCWCRTKRLVDSRFGTGTPSIARVTPDFPLQVRVTDLVSTLRLE